MKVSLVLEVKNCDTTESGEEKWSRYLGFIWAFPLFRTNSFIYWKKIWNWASHEGSFAWGKSRGFFISLQLKVKDFSTNTRFSFCKPYENMLLSHVSSIKIRILYDVGILFFLMHQLSFLSGKKKLHELAIGKSRHTFPRKSG